MCKAKLSQLFAFGLAVSITLSAVAHGESFPRSKNNAPPQTDAFINGHWFDGQAFSKGTWYSVHGTLTRSQPELVGKIIDLRGGYVVPPFGEAHTHNVEGEWDIDQVINYYLRDGIFYVKNPNNVPEFVEKILHKLNKPQSTDTVFAHAGLTGPQGHSIRLYEEGLRIHRYEPVIGKREKGWVKGRAYVSISSMTDLENQWPAIRARKPDFIKLYLAGSEFFSNSDQSTEHGFRKGLDPRLIAPLVSFAHQQGFTVTAHIETAADFRTAFQGGVDEIAHVPGWFLPNLDQRPAVPLTPEDAQPAAKHQAVVVTTTVASHFHPHGYLHLDQQNQHCSPSSSVDLPTSDQALRKAAQTIQATNLQLLHQAGVKISIGSDHAETALAEALHLHHLGVFDNLTLLKIWCEATPQSIFPSRKFGQLKTGYEASFLVLRENPLQDFKHVRNISYRFKQGHPLVLDQ